jgi:hypothetical protein
MNQVRRADAPATGAVRAKQPAGPHASVLRCSAVAGCHVQLPRPEYRQRWWDRL